MTKAPKRPRDPNQLAKSIVNIATGEVADSPQGSAPSTMAALGRSGGSRAAFLAHKNSPPNGELRSHLKRRRPDGRGTVRAVNANQAVDGLLMQFNKGLEKKLDAHILLIRAGMDFGLDDAIREEIEDINPVSKRKKEKLAVILETNGGYVEVVERIYAVFRKHYSLVDFYIPNFAYSAGTVLALSGDCIFMDYFSVLGPIDPQFQTENGDLLPGMGYLAKYNELIKQINTPKIAGDNTTYDAEIAILLKKFDPAKIFAIEQSVAHGESLLRTWLPMHKFKDWNVTEGAGNPVTQDMKVKRAEEIAKVLGDAERWNSHGRGIGMKDLESDELKLKVNDFGVDDELSRNIRTYRGLFVDFCGKTKAQDAIHTEKGIRRIG